MAKKMVKSKATKRKAKKSSGKKRGKGPLVTPFEDASDLKSDEPSVREGSYTKGLVNEADVEEEEDAEEKGFYGDKEEGI